MKHEKTESVRINSELMKVVRKSAEKSCRTIKAQIEYAIKKELIGSK